MSAKKSSAAKAMGVGPKTVGQKSLFSFFSTVPSECSTKANSSENSLNTPIKTPSKVQKPQYKTPSATKASISQISSDISPKTDSSSTIRFSDHSISGVGTADESILPISCEIEEHRSSQRKRNRYRIDSDEEEFGDSEITQVKTTALQSNNRPIPNDSSDGENEAWMEDESEDESYCDRDEPNVKRKGSDSKKLGSTIKKLRKNGDTDSVQTSVTSSGSKKVSISNENKKYEKSPVTYLNKISSSKVAESSEKMEIIEEEPKSMKHIELPDGVINTGGHLHHSFEWLKAEKRMDAKKRKPEHPEFNPRTLYIPPSFRANETAAMQQWWDIKSQNMDIVLFFKVGKFYELFHMDADIGMQELDLIYMKGEKAHSGFPEISYSKFADILVDKGYRVARVEQTETPEMLKERNKDLGGRNSAPKDKVVKRELCSILSKGTRTYCFLDSQSKTLQSSTPLAPLLSLVERQIPRSATPLSPAEDEDLPPATCEYGVCLVDTSTATFQLGQFADTNARTRLRTLLSQFPPVEVLYERGGLSDSTLHLLKCIVPSALIIELIPDEEFWGPEKTIQELNTVEYFESGNQNSTERNKLESMKNWPDLLKAVVQGGVDSELCVASLGAVIFHLRRSLIDHDLISMKRFNAYIPSDEGIESSNVVVGSSTGIEKHKHMVLDGVALANLEVLRNSYDGSEKGSLWSLINRCSTAFGKRLLKDWLCRPLFDSNEIDERLNAVQELVQSLAPEASALRTKLKELPDIERLLSRVHSMASVHRANSHPDSRAVMYELDKYGSRKVGDFCSVLSGLETAGNLIQSFAKNCGIELNSSLLKQCLLLEGESGSGSFPNVIPVLSWFRDAFDAEKAKKERTIRPRKGVDEVYDNAKESIACILKELDKHLEEVGKQLRCSSVKYYHAAKERYQIEIPENTSVPADFDLRSKKKGFRRFWTPFISKKLQDLANAESMLEDGERDQMRKLFEKFDKHRNLWASAVSWLAVLDALLALASVSAMPGYVRPEFKEGVEPFVKFKKARHPCIAQTYQGVEFIPNDTFLGPDPSENGVVSPIMLMLSGPNMGGKSTLLRQTCLLVILAQIGCFVPAENAELTPVDRIFTRVGASDRILAGQSTFFVELSETATILHHATPKSLVILDELGRGTSTFDGSAIAHAVVSHLVHKIKCLTLFATHYHSLVEEAGLHSQVKNVHMGCIVHGQGEEKGVTFLYTLQNGPCPKSFGINVARLARLPAQVLANAERESLKFEATFQNSKSDSGFLTSVGEKLTHLLDCLDIDGASVEIEIMKLWESMHK